jgi:hypothetical protein
MQNFTVLWLVLQNLPINGFSLGQLSGAVVPYGFAQ